MALREVIRIDEELCDGCGLCVPACAEGAIAVVGGKARLVSEVYCDGLGACLGHCPQSAITIECVEALPFDERAVAAHLAGGAAGSASPRAARGSLGHPAQRGAVAPPHGGGCPGSRMEALEGNRGSARVYGAADAGQPSMLRQWPVQLHLLSPAAPFLRGAEVLLAADCVAFAAGDFHRAHLAGRALAVACPKLDSNQESYLEKLTAFVDQAGISSLTVMIMQVPCCSGLVHLAVEAVARASRPVPVRYVVVGIQGDVLDEGPVPVAQRAAATALPVRQ